MPSSAGGARRRSPAEAQAAIERFLKDSRQPILLEAGENHFPLTPGNFLIETSAGRLTLQAWDEARCHVRRVTGLIEEKPGRLTLGIERFPKREGSLQLIDLARPAQEGTLRLERRLSFREQFRHLLAREFAGWKIAELTSEQDLEHSLSPAFPRALLRQGASGLAAIGAPAGGRDVDGALTFGLIWLDYLRRREPRLTIEGLALFLPHGREKTTCLRLGFLNRAAANYLAYVYSPEGFAAKADLKDHGNLDTRLEPCHAPSAGLSQRVLEWIGRIARLPCVERVEKTGGGVSLRVCGLEFARAEGDTFEFGLEQRRKARESNVAEVEATARELARLRSHAAMDRKNPLYMQQPESWLESRIRECLEEVDPALAGSPVYSQAPSFAAGGRGVVDLLAVERSGRLAILEVKATEDVHLPLQALDYWMRVQWHLARGEFGKLGYFPGVPLLKEAPRLLLVAPSLHFHPTTEAILRCFAPEVPVERIGLGLEWRRKIKAAFRLRGCEARS